MHDDEQDVDYRRGPPRPTDEAEDDRGFRRRGAGRDPRPDPVRVDVDQDRLYELVRQCVAWDLTMVIDEAEARVIAARVSTRLAQQLANRGHLVRQVQRPAPSVGLPTG